MDRTMDIRDKIAELRENGFCILKAHLSRSAVEACRAAFWPALLGHLRTHAGQPNRGPHRHFLPMPFEPPCFNPAFFFDPEVLGIVHDILDKRAVADQWGCDVPLKGSEHQGVHADYQRPLFAEAPELALPAYMLVMSFGLTRITLDDGAIEIAPGTHRMPREQALRAVAAGEIAPQAVPLEIGDVLLRHPWALHRGTPNLTNTPRALVSIRYVRRWYADSSRDINEIPAAVWHSLSPDQQAVMRFAIKL